MMDETRFKALAAAFGGDMARWPEAERAAAHAFAEAEPEPARSVLTEAGALDEWLAEIAPVEPDEALFNAVMAQAATRPGAPSHWIGLAASLTLMIGAGAGWMAAPSSDPYAQSGFAEAFGALEDPSSLEDLGLEEAR